jgi:hypothetical protein
LKETLNGNALKIAKLIVRSDDKKLPFMMVLALIIEEQL